ncbi:hypothetical protein FJW08_08095 [Mesorhizobium sp. B3-2-1]|nr:hypothetical protein FJW08_08095 [Mesorhizobium sp. B3-2-1]
MIESRTDIARAVLDASLLLQHHSRAYITSIQGDIAQTRRAIAASQELLKRFRRRKMDEALRDERHRVSAFHADIVRSVFRNLVSETDVPRCQWRNLARSLIFELTGCERPDAALVDWIIRK